MEKKFEELFPLITEMAQKIEQDADLFRSSFQELQKKIDKFSEDNIDYDFLMISPPSEKELATIETVEFVRDITKGFSAGFQIIEMTIEKLNFVLEAIKNKKELENKDASKFLDSIRIKSDGEEENASQNSTLS